MPLDDENGGNGGGLPTIPVGPAGLVPWQHMQQPLQPPQQLPAYPPLPPSPSIPSRRSSPMSNRHDSSPLIQNPSPQAGMPMVPLSDDSSDGGNWRDFFNTKAEYRQWRADQPWL